MCPLLSFRAIPAKTGTQDAAVVVVGPQLARRTILFWPRRRCSLGPAFARICVVGGEVARSYTGFRFTRVGPRRMRTRNDDETLLDKSNLHSQGATFGWCRTHK